MVSWPELPRIPVPRWVAEWFQDLAAFTAWWRYQSMVFSNPARRDVSDRHPNSAAARVVSRHLRGWPSGLLAFQRTLAVEPTAVRIISSKSRTLISSPEPRLTRSGLEYFSAASTIASAASST